MSKKMWHKIFKSSKSTTKNSKLATAHKANKRCSIYEEYQQLQAAEEQQQQQLQKRQQQQQQQEQQQQEFVAAQNAAAEDKALPTTTAANKKNATAAAAATNVSELLINNCSYNENSNSNNTKHAQSAFAKVVSSFSLKRSAAPQQKQQLDAASSGNGNSRNNAAKSGNKTPKNNSNIIASPTEPYPNAPAELVACPSCQRTFNPITLLKHVGICQKMSSKKRHVFDSSRQRREGTELASYPLPKNYGLPPTKQERGHSPKPLTQHIASPILTRKKSGEELTRSTARASMRKMSTTSSHSGVHSPTATTANTSTLAATCSSTSLISAGGGGAGSNFTRDRMRSSERSLAKRIQPPPAEQCPHCDRCFGVKAYDRHVEWCKEKALQATIKQGTKTEQKLAKERLEARTKYRAPCLKTKRSINRDKYAGLAGDENDFADHPKAGYNSNNNSIISNNNSNGIMSLSMTSSMTSDRNTTNLGNRISESRTSKNRESNHRVESTSPKVRESIESANFDDYNDFHLMGAHLSTPDRSNKKMKRAKSRDTSTTTNQQSSTAYSEQNKTRHICSSLTSEQAKDQKSLDNIDLSKTITFSNLEMSGMERSSPPASTSNSSTQVSISDNNAVTQALNQRRMLKTKQKSTVSLHLTPAEAVLAAVARDDVITKDLKTSTSLPQIQKSQSPVQQRQQRQSTPPPSSAQKKRIALFDVPSNTATTAISIPTPTATRKSGMSAFAGNADDSHSTRLELNPIKSLTICRPKRKKMVRQTVSSHTTPLKAIPLLKESIEIFGTPTKVMSSTSTNTTNSTGNKQKNCVARDSHVDMANDKEIKVIKAPPRSTPALSRNKSFILSGLPTDKYDPFVSAKRQLEDLCSSSPPMNISPDRSKTPHTTTASQATSLPAKMTTSLTLSSSSPNSSPLTTNSQNRSASLATKGSNFRRTSSLRGPRRSPMLPSRPLFAQNHRPTIQRGLSDEGPISTNFLKPEEYDEMPVRSVCVNDYAITKSPRVVRRDSSLSNRKQALKLNVHGDVAAAAAATATSPAPAAAAVVSPTTSTFNAVYTKSKNELLEPAARYLSKTDSLAAFLKYENELAKLQAPNALCATSSKPVEHSPPVSPMVAQNLVHSPVTTKELKDKSNTLSKQNSAKSIKAECVESPKPQTSTSVTEQREKLLQQLPTVDNPTYTPTHTNTPAQDKTNHLRLEPISLPQATSTPISKVSVTRTSALPTPTTTQLPAVNQPINLNALFGDSKLDVGSRGAFGSKERKHSSSTEYIDPKLINKCDNLPVNLSSVRSLKNNTSDNMERRSEVCTSSSTPSSESSATQTGPISQLTKLLPLAKGVDDRQIPQPHTTATAAFNIPANPSAVTAATNQSGQQSDTSHPMLSQRSSAEGRNLLKRKMRLGRNQFLYDASPEADDSCSADDEANRSSAEYDNHQYQQAQPQSQHQPQPQMRSQPAPLKTPPIIPSIPIFDDFDFEEFLSSFEHDDEQFPLFKDCREFLLNRTSNKQRSTPKPNSIFINTGANTNNNTNSNTNGNGRTAQQHNQPMRVTNASPNTHTHFQFPSLSNTRHPTHPAHPTLLLTPSSFRSSDAYTSLMSATTKKESSPQPSIKSTSTTDAYNDDPKQSRTSRYADSDQKKREIFISIETEQSENGRSPISPESLRNLVGNPQTMVEVEVDAMDNKFSKISDDEPLPPTPNQLDALQHQSSFVSGGNHLPNVQLNNAKNLMQKMQDDFRHRNEEVGASLRQSKHSNSGNNNNGNNLLYGDEGATAHAMAGAMPLHDGDVDADSDDMSSLDGYPISAKSSRRGVGSKLSADSAYGSLSRQRSSELSTHRSLSRSRPNTATSATNTTMPAPMLDAATQHRQLLKETAMPPAAYKYPTQKGRARQFSGSSSSDNSDGPLPKIGGGSGGGGGGVGVGGTCNANYQQQQAQQQQQILYNNNFDAEHGRYEHGQQQLQRTGSGKHRLHSSNNNNNNNFESPLSSPSAGLLDAAAGASSSNTSVTGSNPAMSASMKMSKFCHECGSKFIIEQAKFCMDCGVRRIVL